MCHSNIESVSHGSQQDRKCIPWIPETQKVYLTDPSDKRKCILWIPATQCILWIPAIHTVYLMDPSDTESVSYGSQRYIQCILWIPAIHTVYLMDPAIHTVYLMDPSDTYSVSYGSSDIQSISHRCQQHRECISWTDLPRQMDFLPQLAGSCNSLTLYHLATKVVWLAGSLTSQQHAIVYLRGGSAQTCVRAATLR